MPAFDYQCPEGHTTEHFLSSFKENITCGFWFDEKTRCGKSAKYRPSFYYNSQSAQRFTPVVIHRDAAGNVRFPAHVNAPIPEGFQKVELTDFHQIRKFEKEINDRDQVQAKEFQNSRQKFLDGQLTENRRALNAILAGGKWDGVDKDGKPVTRQGMSPQGRKFYEKMREISMQKQQKSRSNPNPAFYLDAFSNDSSNRESYRDQQNDWGRSGDRK